MTFTYERTIATYFSKKHDEYFDDSYEFDFHAEPSDVLDAIVDILIDEANGGELSKEERKLMQKITRSIIVENDLQTELEDKYYDELKEHFRDIALDSEIGD